MNDVPKNEFDEIWNTVELRLDSLTFSEKIIKSLILHPFSTVNKLSITLWLLIMVLVQVFGLHKEFLMICKAFL